VTYEITVLRTVVKNVERLPKEVQDRVVQAITELAETPRPELNANLIEVIEMLPEEGEPEF
jgi:mRNA-degrading endonuclease RelE of RelBE toxin-antitoxin system